MTPYRPRDALATHEVTNQPAPLGDLNLYADDPLLSGVVGAALKAVGGHETHSTHLAAFGEAVGREATRDLGRLANESPPKLKPFDRYGRRIDEVEFHPAYHDLMALGLEAGVSSRAWTHPTGGHIAHSALMGLMTWADGGVCCPMSMTYAVRPALRASDWADAEWTPRLTAARYDGRALPAEQKAGATLGMAMTEKQGGSDVRANATRAGIVSQDGEAILTGHKWFCSAPMSDAFLTLAYEDDGLSCFLVPRWRPDGTRNAIEIQRLKDKLGDRSNASSEIEYRGAWAKRVGEPGRGVPTIIEMVNHTRLDCVVGSAMGVRIAVALAIHHCEGRSAFQKKLIDQPLMTAVLADLALEAEAGLALAFRVARGFDTPAEAALMRVLTPVAKYWLCKRCPAITAEAMECLGGAGFVEESGMPRLFRASPLNGIWEGSGNVIALDVLRALRNPQAAEAWADYVRGGGDLPGAGRALASWLADPTRAFAAGEAGARLFAERAALFATLRTLTEDRPAIAADWTDVKLAAPAHTFGAALSGRDARRLADRARLAV